MFYILRRELDFKVFFKYSLRSKIFYIKAQGTHYSAIRLWKIKTYPEGCLPCHVLFYFLFSPYIAGVMVPVWPVTFSVSLPSASLIQNIVRNICLQFVLKLKSSITQELFIVEIKTYRWRSNAGGSIFNQNSNIFTTRKKLKSFTYEFIE